MGGASSKVGIKSDNSEILLALKTMQQKLEDNDTKLNTKIDQLNLKIKKIELDLQKSNKQNIEYEKIIDYFKPKMIEKIEKKKQKNGKIVDIVKKELSSPEKGIKRRITSIRK